MTRTNAHGIHRAAAHGLLAFALCLAAAPGRASAQDRIDLERFRPALDHDGFIGMQGTTTPGPGVWNAGFWVHYERSPLVGVTADGERDIVSHRVMGDLQLQVGIGGRFGVGLDVPLVLRQHVTDLALDAGAPIQSNGLGDPRLTARVRLVGEPSTAQRERHEGPGVALATGLTLPVGTEEAFAGEGLPTMDLALTTDFHLLGLGAGVMVGWRQRFEERRLAGVRFREELLFGLGVNVPIPVVPGFQARADLRVATDGRAPFADGRKTVLELDLGASLRREDVTVWLAAGVGLSNGVGVPAARAILGVSWAPRVDDADEDGVPDDLDGCPHLPEDFDGFEDEDGCMDPDNDDDFVPDIDDRCPDEQALEGYDEDEDGCTDPGAPGE